MTSPLQSTLASLNVPCPEFRFCIQESDARAALKRMCRQKELEIDEQGSNAWILATTLTELREARQHIDALQAALLLAVEAARVHEREWCAKDIEDDSDSWADTLAQNCARNWANRLRSLAAQPGVGK